jgi:hypothetical protein
MKVIGPLLACAATVGCAGEAALEPTSPPRNCDGTWVAAFGDGDGQAGRWVTTYANGDIALGGAFRGHLDLGGGPLAAPADSGLFVARLDACGGHVWSKAFELWPDGGSDTGRSAAVDASDNLILFVTGRGTADLGGGPLSGDEGTIAALLKLDSAGSHVFSFGLGASIEAQTGAVATGPNGDITVVGSFRGTLSFGGTELTSVSDSDAFVLHFDANGNHLWSRSFGSEAPYQSTTSFSAVRVDGTGDIVIGGSVDEESGVPITIDLGGGPLEGAGAGTPDGLVVKLAPDGAHRWSKRFGGSGQVRVGRIALGPMGEVLLSGSLSQGVGSGIASFGGDAISAWDGSFVAKLDANGEHLASLALPYIESSAIDLLGSGEVVVAGFAQGTGGNAHPTVGGTVMRAGGFFAALGPTFDLAWSVSFEHTTFARVADVATDASGGLLVTGSFGGTNDELTVEDVHVTSAGGTDALLVRYLIPR